MPATLHARLGKPTSYTVPSFDELVVEATQSAGEPQNLDAAWAVEFVGRCLQVLAGERFLRVREPNLHPRVLASLNAAGGSRLELIHPWIRAVRFQRDPLVTRMAGMVRCGAIYRAFTAEFRPAGAGWWLTHLGVL
ncbi:MAG: hypothetical protein U0R23_12440 [Candidatus Nanopelagicales bacterium]